MKWQFISFSLAFSMAFGVSWSGSLFAQSTHGPLDDENESTLVESEETSEEEPAPAQVPVQPTPSKLTILEMRLSLGVVGDDNILHLRDDSIEEFESGTFAPERYLVDSVDDAVFGPEVELGYAIRPPSGRHSRIRFSATGFRFASNSIKNYERYRVRFQQDLNRRSGGVLDPLGRSEELSLAEARTSRAFARANRSRLQLSYALTPERYQYQLKDVDAGTIDSAMLGTNTWDALYIQRLNDSGPNRFSLGFRYTYDDLNWNEAFDERDSGRNRLGVSTNWFYLRNQLYWQLGAGYAFERLGSNTDLIGQQGPGGTVQDDLSYDGNTLNFTVGAFWYRGNTARRSSALISYVYRTIDFTTDNRADRSHFGRDDSYRRLSASYTHPLANSVSIRLDLNVITRDTNLPLDRFEPSAYKNTVFGVNFNYYLGRVRGR